MSYVANSRSTECFSQTHFSLFATDLRAAFQENGLAGGIRPMLGILGDGDCVAALHVLITVDRKTKLLAASDRRITLTGLAGQWLMIQSLSV